MTMFNANKPKRVLEIDVKELDQTSDEMKNISLNIREVKKLGNRLKLESKKAFDSNEILNDKYLIKSAGNHLYECGLSFYQFLPGRKRKTIFNPYWVAFVHCVIALRHIISMVIPDSYDRVHIYIGDFAQILNAKAHINPAIFLSITILLLTKCLHFWDHIRGVKPGYLKPFGMVSGLYPPQSVGLVEEKYIKLMVNILKWGQLVAELNTYYIILVALSMSFIPMIFVYKWYELILFGIPWSLLFSLSIYYTVIHYLFNNLYFLFICVYFKSKLKQLNRRIDYRIKIKSRKFVEIHKLIQQLDFVYSEISAYNDMYWSKFNLMFISLISLVINLFLYQSFYGEMFWYLRIIFLYFSGFMIVLMMSYLKMNSMIFNEANKAYKTMTTLYLEYNTWSLSLSLRLKV